ncbi:hypothetical protein RQP46_005047 [Phenoliferia psychrophenolica]
MIAGPLSLRAVLALSLFATSALAKPQPHDSDSAASQSSLATPTDATLFERYVANHLPSFHHSRFAVAVINSAHTSHLSALLHDAHDFVVSGKAAPRERSVKMAHRASVLSQGPRPARRRAANNNAPVVEITQRLGKASRERHESKKVDRLEKRTFDDEENDETGDDEDSWGWTDSDADVDEEAAAEAEVDEEESLEAIASRMVVRVKRTVAVAPHA